MNDNPFSSGAPEAGVPPEARERAANSPLRTAWTNPRSATRSAISDRAYQNYPWIFAILFSCIVAAPALWESRGNPMGLAVDLAFSAGGGAIQLLLGSALLSLTGALLGGRVRFREIIIASGWNYFYPATLVLAPLLAVIRALAPAPDSLAADPLWIAALLGLLLPLAYILTLVVRGLSECMQITTGRAFLVWALAFLGIAGPVLGCLGAMAFTVLA